MSTFTALFCVFQVGENGAGKTTLLKILLGELSPTKGVRHAHRNLRIGYFSQHHVDQLDMSLTSVEMLAEKFPGTVNILKCRTFFSNKSQIQYWFSGLGLTKCLSE